MTLHGLKTNLLAIFVETLQPLTIFQDMLEIRQFFDNTRIRHFPRITKISNHRPPRMREFPRNAFENYK